MDNIGIGGVDHGTWSANARVNCQGNEAEQRHSASCFMVMAGGESQQPLECKYAQGAVAQALANCTVDPQETTPLLAVRDRSSDSSGSGSWSDSSDSGSGLVEQHNPVPEPEPEPRADSATLIAGVGGVGVVGGASATAIGGTAIIGGASTTAAGGTLTAWGLLLGGVTILGLSGLVLLPGVIMTIRSQRGANDQRNDIESQPPIRTAPKQVPVLKPAPQQVPALEPAPQQVPEFETLYNEIKAGIEKLYKEKSNWEIFKEEAYLHINKYSQQKTGLTLDRAGTNLKRGSVFQKKQLDQALSDLMNKGTNSTDPTLRESIHTIFLKIQLSLVRYTHQP